jgi:peptide/nickel transport system substrate-binding protein/oligopeptide transport system substrate-binding protein
VEDAYQWLLVEQLFDGLVDLDPELKIVPAIARTWTVSRDGLEYRFTLRGDARFHNGRAVIAADVAWSFLRALRVPGGLATEYLGHVVGAREAAQGAASEVSGIRVEGANVVTIRLAHPYAPFLGTLAIPQLGIVPREEVESRGEAFARHPVGSGPFELKEWRDDGRVVLVPSDRHWAGRPYLDRVEVQLGAFGADEAGPFLKGRTDWAFISRADEERLPKWSRIVKRMELGITVLGLNVARPPLDDVRIRRALAMSLDRNTLVEASGRVATPASSVVPMGMAGAPPFGSVPSEDLEGARRLLAEAGHPDGKGLPPLELWLNGESAPTLAVGRAAAKHIARIGLQVNVQTAPWTAFLEKVDAKEAPAYLLTWVADTPDRDSFLGVLFHSAGVNNHLHYADPMVDRLIEEARRELDPIARRDLYRAVEERVDADCVLVPLYTQANVYALRDGLAGFNLDALGQIDLSRIYWERSSGGVR